MQNFAGTKVTLIYFKPTTGKYYASGEYITQKEHAFEIYQEILAMWERRQLPGIREGGTQFVTLITGTDLVPDVVGLEGVHREAFTAAFVAGRTGGLTLEDTYREWKELTW